MMPNNPLDKGKEAMAKRMMSQITPSQTPLVNAAAQSISSVEHQQAAAINSALATAGIDQQLRHDPDERQQTVLSLADAVGEQRVQSWWFEHVAPHLLDQPEKAQSYVGYSSEDWHDQLRDWYRMHYQNEDNESVETPLADADPARIGEVADRHIQAVFGVSLREFVAIVVNWTKGEQLQGVLFGPIQKHTQWVRRLEHEINVRDQRIAELETRIEDLERR